jgi:uncharacterized lipoprotein YajG
MQNEERINGLETQVRTLKRIVCLVCCLFGVFMFVGCSATSKSTDKDNLAQDKVEKITTVSVCRNCVEDKIYISNPSTKGKMIQVILAGGDSRYNLHSESDCQSSE